MADPARILKKILGPAWNPETFQDTGEPLELLLETLREVVRCRRCAAWLEEHSGLRAALPPEDFQALLDLPEVNFTEVTDRNLDVTRHSLKDQRRPEDPVSVAHLNTVLRELFRDLNALNELRMKNHPQLRLAGEMTGDKLDRAEQQVLRLRGLNWRGAGYLLTGLWARGIEREFERLFPAARRAHPLRRHLDAVQVELGFYRQCLETNIKWARTGLDLFRVIGREELGQTVENLSALGSGLWNVVYQGMRLPKSLALCGLDFADIETLFSEERAPLANY